MYLKTKLKRLSINFEAGFKTEASYEADDTAKSVLGFPHFIFTLEWNFLIKMNHAKVSGCIKGEGEVLSLINLMKISLSRDVGYYLYYIWTEYNIGKYLLTLEESSFFIQLDYVQFS